MATATNVSGSVGLVSGFTEVISTGVISNLNLPANLNLQYTYGNGTSAGNVDLIYAKSLSLAAAATTLDLTSLTDLNGGAVNFARIREMQIVNLATTAAYTLTIGAAASNQWTTGPLGTATATAILQPSVGQTTGSCMLHWCDPFTTGASTGGYVDSTHKLLKLDPGSNTLSCYVLLVGCSAVS